MRRLVNISGAGSGVFEPSPGLSEAGYTSTEASFGRLDPVRKKREATNESGCPFSGNRPAHYASRISQTLARSSPKISWRRAREASSNCARLPNNTRLIVSAKPTQLHTVRAIEWRKCHGFGRNA